MVPDMCTGNDSIILDEQLGDTVIAFFHSNGIFGLERSKSSEHLAQLMTSEEPRVIITTLQKFVMLGTVPIVSPLWWDIASSCSIQFTKEEDILIDDRRVAIIADEAHRSHGKKATRNLHGACVPAHPLVHFCVGQLIM
jgi:type I site-specific restriction-modification system R (restriction) subunit